MNFDDAPRLFYLLLLLFFIGGFFFYQGRARLSQTLQQALIWLGIFMLMIIGYGFRDTLTAQLFPREAVQVDGQTVALTRGRNGAFVTTVELNGVDVEVLVDTGATAVVLTRLDAARIGFDPDRLNYNGVASTANGMVRTATVTIDSLRFGNFSDSNVLASVNEGDLGISLLGMDYLSRFERIEIRGDQMLLERR